MAAESSAPQSSLGCSTCTEGRKLWTHIKLIYIFQSLVVLFTVLLSLCAFIEISSLRDEIKKSSLTAARRRQVVGGVRPAASVIAGSGDGAQYLEPPDNVSYVDFEYISMADDDLRRTNNFDRSRRQAKRRKQEAGDKDEDAVPETFDEIDSGAEEDSNDDRPLGEKKDNWVWLTSYSRVPILKLQEFCLGARQYCPAGPAGEKGERGERGSVGPRGENGKDGVAGIDASGVKGLTSVGATGQCSCPPGPSGPPGPPGPPGVNGSEGERGKRGRAGNVGEPGPPGPKGDKGDRGTGGDGTFSRSDILLPHNCTCEKGQRGEPGEKGKRGLIGFIGYKGEPGEPGPAGPPGPIIEGIPGPPGTPGLPGLKGQKGDPGTGLYVSGLNRLHDSYNPTSTTKPKLTDSTVLSTTATAPATVRPREKDCRLQMIGKPLLQHTTGVIWGAWMKDPAPSDIMHREHVWIAHHYTGKTLMEYESLEQVSKENVLTVHELKEAYFGTGHVIYTGAFFYHRAGYREIVKYDLKENRVIGRVHIPGSRFHGTSYLYSTEYNYFDLAVDENGLWVIYASEASEDKILVSKLNPTDMIIEHTWNIQIRHQDYSNGFIICGTLYLVDNTRTKNSLVDFAYDLYAKEKLSVRLKLTNPFLMNNMLAYNAADQKMYGWDKGNLLQYPLLI